MHRSEELLYPETSNSPRSEGSLNKAWYVTGKDGQGRSTVTWKFNEAVFVLSSGKTCWSCTCLI